MTRIRIYGNTLCYSPDNGNTYYSADDDTPYSPDNDSDSDPTTDNARRMTTMTRSISLDNGNTYYSIDDLSDIAPEIDKHWSALEVMMDDDIREAVSRDMAPCSNLDFLREYLTRATDDLVLG